MPPARSSRAAGTGGCPPWLRVRHRGSARPPHETPPLGGVDARSWGCAHGTPSLNPNFLPFSSTVESVEPARHFAILNDGSCIWLGGHRWGLQQPWQRDKQADFGRISRTTQTSCLLSPSFQEPALLGTSLLGRGAAAPGGLSRDVGETEVHLPRQRPGKGPEKGPGPESQGCALVFLSVKWGEEKCLPPVPVRLQRTPGSPQQAVGPPLTPVCCAQALSSPLWAVEDRGRQELDFDFTFLPLGGSSPVPVGNPDSFTHTKTSQWHLASTDSQAPQSRGCSPRAQHNYHHSGS